MVSVVIEPTVSRVSAAEAGSQNDVHEAITKSARGIYTLMMYGKESRLNLNVASRQLYSPVLVTLSQVSVEVPSNEKPGIARELDTCTGS